MRLKRNKLRDAIAFSLAAGTLALAGTGSVMAQEATQTESSSQTQATSLDTITVTGSRIKSQTMTATSPVVEINAEEFRFAGATTVEDLVNQYPQLDLSFDNFINNGAGTYATVDLRGLGVQRTLTLVNGRRIPKGANETPDISIVPAALIKRVDVLTGGASAVYGSDAIAGVVNFILDDQFEGVSLNAGYSAYQHNNDNKYIQELMDRRNFDYPTGDSGFGGISRNIDLAIGSSFGEGGHAMGWVTWRENKALLQGERDYSSCALNAAGTACGGSGTADPANFYVVAPGSGFYGYVAPIGGGAWEEPDAINIYNYAPINYYQRPDTRITAGFNVKYEINEHFQPYIEGMFVNRKTRTQIAPSGAFFTDVTVNCATPQIGSMCADIGITDDEFTVYVAKRNVEGGPRISAYDATNFSFTTGIGGLINDAWSYDAAFTYGRSTSRSENINDFVTTRVRDALLGCPAGSFSGCIPYEVWTDTITPEQAQALQGVGIVNYGTRMMDFTAFVSGDLGFGLPWANGENVGLVAGYEWRKEDFERVADENMATGNFTGLGGPTTNLRGGLRVEEVFFETKIPLIVDAGALSRLDLEAAYRFSDYSTSGAVDTFKVALGAGFLNDRYRFRAGYNKAIRAPNIGELYSDNQIALWAGEDPCAGPTPEYTAAQCARTGVPADRYGTIAANAASQYNQFIGGNADLEPEEAETWTVGFTGSPIDNLDLAVDYYDIKLENAISTIGARTIIDLCVNGQDAMCSLIRRNATTLDLFRGSDPDVSGLVYNTNGNFGARRFRGIDLTAAYSFALGAGRLSTSFSGNYILEKEYAPVPGDDSATYSCEGLINASCATPDWRHIATARYSIDRYTIGLRWRYIGEMDYKDVDGTPLTSDFFLRGPGKVKAYNYLDLSGSMEFGDYATWTVGVNNIADKEPPMVGGGLGPLNGNALGGYDQAGRFIFTSLTFKF
ncbi:MAG: TonB-dependent receptor [Proteobacteria bacterium]|nr:TonB-dependent receptor [Pseudomonadota bacterium]